MEDFEEVKNFVEEENVKFLKLVYFDAFGNQKCVSIMPQELDRAFRYGISFDAGAVPGFGSMVKSDLFLKPDPNTLSIVPWRPLDGRVARMFCNVSKPDGTPFERDTRYLLRQAVKEAKKEGISVRFGPEMEFYVFRQDENGAPTHDPIDWAGYMAADPEDKGENIRRDICFALLDMGITPEASHHESGPGQNEIDFRYSDALTAADNTTTLKWAVRNLANANGYYADFSPKPLRDAPGSGMHLNLSVVSKDGSDRNGQFMAGIMRYIRDITLFLNPVKSSYERFGHQEAPLFISWSEQNRSQLIRIPADPSGKVRIELRSPDPMANPYLAFMLLIYAGLEGVRKNYSPDLPMNINLYHADPEMTRKLEKLPTDIGEAVRYACHSEFVAEHLPAECLQAYVDRANG